MRLAAASVLLALSSSASALSLPARSGAYHINALRSARRSPQLAMKADGLTVADPARALIAAAWLGFNAYALTGSPGSFDFSADSADNQMILRSIEDPSALNPIFFTIFNALAVLPAVNAALLLPGSRQQSPLPAPPFVFGAFFLGFGAVGPYLIAREPRPDPIARSDLGFFSRYVTESRLFGAGLLAASLFLASVLFTMGDAAAARADFAELFATSKLVHVSSVDCALLSLLVFEPMKEDMARRGWWDEEAAPEAKRAQLARLAAFCLVPVCGPSAYVLLRPALPEE